MPTPTPVDPTAAPLQEGDTDYAQGNWVAALAAYQKALTLRPNDTAIQAKVASARQRLLQSQQQAVNNQSTQQIGDLIANLDNSHAAAAARSADDRQKDEAALAEIESVSHDMDNNRVLEAASAMPRTDAPTHIFHVQDAVYIPALHGGAPLRGPSARVLVEHQPELEEIDRKIATTRKALERLVQNNDASNELREQAEHESEEATREAADVGLKLVIDLAGARLEAMGNANDRASEDAVEKLLHSDPAKPLSPEFDEKCARLIEEKERLEQAERLTDIAEKTNDAVEKMAPGEESAEHPFTASDLYDIVTQMKAVGNIAGPSKDLIDAVYAMYHQASSSMQLLRVGATNEKQYQAVAGLQRTLNKLLIQQRALQQQRAASAGHPQ